MMFPAIKCKRLEALYWDYAAYRLSERDRLRVRSHLAACPRCRREAARYEAAVRMADELRTMDTPLPLSTWRELRPALLVEKRRLMRQPSVTFQFAAAGVILAAIMVFHAQPGSLRNGTMPPVQLGAPTDASDADTSLGIGLAQHILGAPVRTPLLSVLRSHPAPVRTVVRGLHIARFTADGDDEAPQTPSRPAPALAEPAPQIAVDRSDSANAVAQMASATSYTDAAGAGQMDYVLAPAVYTDSTDSPHSYVMSRLDSGASGAAITLASNAQGDTLPW